MNISPSAIISAAIIPLAAAACSSGSGDTVTYDVTADVTVPPSSKSPAPGTAGQRDSGTIPSHAAPVRTALPDITDAATDGAPYRLGHSHGLRLHSQCRTEGEIRDELLDINARVTNITARVSPEAAASYLRGLHDALAETGDTLASTLF